jgi:hypothetical protein
MRQVHVSSRFFVYPCPKTRLKWTYLAYMVHNWRGACKNPVTTSFMVLRKSTFSVKIPWSYWVYFVTSYHVCDDVTWCICTVFTWFLLLLIHQLRAIHFETQFYISRNRSKMQPWFLHQSIEGTPIFQIMSLPQFQQDWRLPDSCTHPFKCTPRPPLENLWKISCFCGSEVCNWI